MRPYESPGPGRGSVAPVSQANASSETLADSQPAAGKEEGRAVVLRREWPCSLLLWTGRDPAAAGWTEESGHILSRRPAYGAAKGLTHLR